MARELRSPCLSPSDGWYAHGKAWGAPAGVRRLLADTPSKAITGGALSEFLHPSENRNLTLRECARIQTFSDQFAFRGTCAEQALLIGNAVPPLLATIFAQSLAADLTTTEPRTEKGQLLSFAPTLSRGMSPILERVTQLVRSIFRVGPHTQKELLLWD